jgi:hypothetical protein
MAETSEAIAAPSACKYESSLFPIPSVHTLLRLCLWLRCGAALCCRIFSIGGIFSVSSTISVLPDPKKIIFNKTN